MTYDIAHRQCKLFQQFTTLDENFSTCAPLNLLAGSGPTPKCSAHGNTTPHRHPARYLMCYVTRYIPHVRLTQDVTVGRNQTVIFQKEEADKMRDVLVATVDQFPEIGQVVVLIVFARFEEALK